jgi:hypothetical protein
MSNLLNTTEGRQAILVAQRFQLERRLSRFFHRTIVIDFSNYEQGLSEFDLGTMLGQLNPAWDNEILEYFRLLGAVGGLSVSIADTTYYVDALLGNDVTGTGSALRPFSSLWFLENLPRRLNHACRVVLMTDINEPDTALNLDFDFGDNGSFAIIGRGAPLVVDTNTIDGGGVVNLRGGGGIALLSPAAWGPNVDNNFLQPTSGAALMYAVPIHSKPTASAIITQGPPLTIPGIAPGDAVRVVRPARTLTVKSIFACCRGSARANRSQLALVNLQIDFPDTLPPFNAPINSLLFWHNDCVSTISFVNFLDTSWGSDYLFGQSGTSIGGFINTDVLHDHTQVIALANCAVANLDAPFGASYAPTICGFEMSGPVGVQHMDIIPGSSVMAMDSRKTIHFSGSSIMTFSNMGVAYCKQANMQFDSCVLDGRVKPVGIKDYAAFEVYNSTVEAYTCTALISDNVVSMFGNSQMKLVQVGTDAVFSTIGNGGVWSEGTNHVDAFYGDPASTPLNKGMVGAVGQLIGYTASAGEVPVAWGALDVSTAFGNATAIVVR